MDNYIIIYTRQKCGTHLISNIVALLIKNDCNIFNKESMYKIVPHFDGFHQYSPGNIKNKIFSTHPTYLNYNNNGINNSYIIASVRNPIDVCISFYFYRECRKPQYRRMSLIDYVKYNINKTCMRLRDHIKFVSNNPNRLLIRYEEMINNKKEAIIKIATFIKKRSNLNLKLDDALIDDICYKTDIKIAKKEENKRGMYKVGDVQVCNFHRDGSIGQWKKHFNDNFTNNLFQYIKINHPDIFTFFYS